MNIKQLKTKTGDLITNPAAISENLSVYRYFANIREKIAETIPEVDANNMNATAPTGMINSLTPTYPNEINNTLILIVLSTRLKIKKQSGI